MGSGIDPTLLELDQLRGAVPLAAPPPATRNTGAPRPHSALLHVVDHDMETALVVVGRARLIGAPDRVAGMN